MERPPPCLITAESESGIRLLRRFLQTGACRDDSSTRDCIQNYLPKSADDFLGNSEKNWTGVYSRNPLINYRKIFSNSTEVLLDGAKFEIDITQSDHDKQKTRDVDVCAEEFDEISFAENSRAKLKMWRSAEIVLQWIQMMAKRCRSLTMSTSRDEPLRKTQEKSPGQRLTRWTPVCPSREPEKKEIRWSTLDYMDRMSASCPELQSISECLHNGSCSAEFYKEMEIKMASVVSTFSDHCNEAKPFDPPKVQNRTGEIVGGKSRDEFGSSHKFFSSPRSLGSTPTNSSFAQSRFISELRRLYDDRGPSITRRFIRYRRRNADAAAKRETDETKRVTYVEADRIDNDTWSADFLYCDE